MWMIKMSFEDASERNLKVNLSYKLLRKEDKQIEAQRWYDLFEHNPAR